MTSIKLRSCCKIPWLLFFFFVAFTSKSNWWLYNSKQDRHNLLEHKIPFLFHFITYLSVLYRVQQFRWCFSLKVHFNKVMSGIKLLDEFSLARNLGCHCWGSKGSISQQNTRVLGVYTVATLITVSHRAEMHLLAGSSGRHTKAWAGVSF